MRRESLSNFFFATLPITVAAFCIEVITILSPAVWVAALLQLPVWAVLIFWLWHLSERRQLLEELAEL